MNLGKCHTTAIGSLPFLNVEDGHQLIRDHLHIPHWPQLPKLGAGEGFINQFVRPLVQLGLICTPEGKSPYFATDRDDFIDLLTDFYSLYLSAMEGEQEALDKFGFQEDSAVGFYSFIDKIKSGYYGQPAIIKGQVSGPITLGLQITDVNRRSSYYNEQLRDVLTKALALHAKWQAGKLMSLGAQALLFIDDPGLYSLGLSTHITLTKEGISQDLTQVIDAIKSRGALVGSHTCASTDWSMLFELDLNVVNFDSYEYFSSLGVQSEETKKYLDKGGILAFGIIPTSPDIFKHTGESLVDLLEQQLDILANKGIDKELLLKQTIITPSCGTGTLNEDMAKRIYLLTQEVSQILRNKYKI